MDPLSAGLNLFGGLNQYGLNQQNYANQSNLQSQYFDKYNESQQKDFDRQTGAFTKYGLPEFMANGNIGSRMPGVTFGLGGKATQRAGLMGARMPNQSHFGQMMGWGTPQPYQEQGNNLNGPPPPYSPPVSDGGLNPPPQFGNDQNPFPFANNNGNLDAVGRPIKGFFPGQ